MMLCGLQALLKFVSGRVLGLMGGERSSECWQLLVRLKAPEALRRLDHTGGGHLPWAPRVI